VAKKKYTRKQLRQPDELLTQTNKAWEWVTKNAKGVIVMTVVTLVIIGAVSMWRSHAESNAQAATSLLDKAIEIRNQTVIPGADKLPKRDDGIKRYSTRKAKLEAAVKAYDKVITGHADSGTGKMALVLRAGVFYDLGQFDKAAADYKNFLEKTGTDQGRFRTAAIEGLVYSYEAKKAWDKALATVGKLEKKGQARFTALIHEARILAAKGDKPGAIKRYKEIVDKASSRVLVDQAGQRLAALESK
jgi:predicted negative regulator of RcsB-dependent stress response